MTLTVKAIDISNTDKNHKLDICKEISSVY